MAVIIDVLAGAHLTLDVTESEVPDTVDVLVKRVTFDVVETGPSGPPGPPGPPGPSGGGGVAFAAGGSTLSSGTGVFVDSNGVSFGLNGSTITASHNGLTAQSSLSYVAGGAVVTNLAGSTLTISAPVQTSLSYVAQGGASTTLAGSTLTIAAPTTTPQTSLSFVAQGGVSTTLGGSTLSINAPTTTPQSVQSLGVYASSQTTGQSSSSTVDARSLTVRGMGNVSAGLSGGELVISGSGGGAADGFNVLAAGTQTAGTATTVVFSDSNNVSFGMSGSSRVTASASFPAQTSLSFVAGGVVSTTLAGSTLTVSATVPAQTNQSLGLYGSSNTSGTSSGTADARSLTFVARGGVSVDLTNGRVNISGITSTPQTAQTVGVYGSGNTSGTSSGTLDARSFTVQAQGSLTVNMTDGRINLSAPNALTTAMASNRGTDFVQATAVFNGTNASGTIASNSWSVSVAAQTAQTVGIYGSSNTSGTSSGTADARSLSFQAAGNLSVNMTNGRVNLSVPAQTAQSLGLYASSNTTGQSSSSTVDARSLTVRGAGIVSAGMSGGELVISASAAGAADGFNILAAGTQTAATNTTVVFSDSNNVSFGMSGSSRVTASASFPAQTSLSFVAQGGVSTTLAGSTLTISGQTTVAQTVQTQNVHNVTLSGNTAGAMAQVSSGTLTLAGGNNITLSQAGNAVTISGPNTVAQSAQTVGVYGSGNTSGTSSGTLDARSLTVNVSGSLSVNMTDGRINLSAPNALTTAMASNRGTDFVQATAVFNGTNASGTIASNSWSVSVAAQTAQTLGLYASSNTTGQSSSTTVDARSLSVRGMGIVSAGYSAGQLVISASAAGAADGVNIIAAGTQTAATTGTVAFSNSNNVSFGMTNSSIVTASASYPAQTNQTVGAYAVSNTTQSTSGTIDARSLSFQGAGGVSVGVSNGSVVVSGGAGAGGLSAGMSTQGNTSGTTGLVASQMLFVGTDGVGLSQSVNGASATLSMKQLVDPFFISGNTSGNTRSITAGSLVFAGGNNITLSQSTAAGGDTITISAAAQSAQTLGLYGSSNTSGTSSGTADARSLTFRAAGNLSVNMTDGRVNLSVPAQSDQTVGLYAVSNTTQSTSGTRDARSLSFAGAGVASVGVTNGTVVVSVPAGGGGGFTGGLSNIGNTSGNTGMVSNRMVLAGGPNVTLSGSTNGESITVTVSAGAGGAGGSMSGFEPLPLLQSGSTTMSMAQGSWYFQPALLPLAIDSGRINVLHVHGGTTGQLPASTATSFASGTTGGHSESFVYNRVAALYSRGTGTNNTRLESYWAGTFPISLSQSVGVSLTNASQLTIQRQVILQFPSQIDISGGSTIATVSATHNQSFANSSTATSAVTSAFSSVYNILSGSVMLPVKMDTSLSAGNWWLAHATLTSLTTAGSTIGPLMTSATIFGFYGASSYTGRAFGVTASSTGSQHYPGLGVFSASSAAAPNNVDFRAIRSIASNVIPYFNIIRSSIS